jgi:hypothetical protein
MRTQETAHDDAKKHCANLIDAMQDADVNQPLIDDAEDLYQRL